MRVGGLIGQRKAPPGVLTAIQEIDPLADIVHLGGSEWLLGVRKENMQAAQRVQDELEQLDGQAGRLGHHQVAMKEVLELEQAKEIEVLQYCARGFRPIHLYDLEETTWPEVVMDFRIRDHNWRTRRDSAIREMKEAISFEERDRWRDEVLIDFWQTEGARHLRQGLPRSEADRDADGRHSQEVTRE